MAETIIAPSAGPSGSGSTPTGTGFVHVTAGVQDGASKTVDVSSADITGRLPYANLVQSAAASRLVGRGSASGAGDWQEITLGTNLSMSGTTLNATGGGGGNVADNERWLVVTSDISVTNSSTLVDATGLAIPIGSSATEVWQFEMQLSFIGTGSGTVTSADLKLAWTFPTGATARWGYHALLGVSNQGVFDPFTVTAVPTATTGSPLVETTQPSVALGATGVKLAGFFRGWWYGGGTAGNAQVRFAEATAVVNTTVTLQKGCVIVARKIIA